MRVKICGLTRGSDVAAAIDYGADALGFIFGYSSSPRNLTFRKLKELISAVPPYLSTVVVSPASNPKLQRVVDEVRPAFLQLYNDDPSVGTGFRNGGSGSENVILTVHLGPPGQQEARQQGDQSKVVQKCRIISKSCKGILLDSAITPSTHGSRNRKQNPKPTPGGTGLVNDWTLARKIRDELYPFPVILGGGLNENNVQLAIRKVRPYAVDVSSGIEATPGVKDHNKMQRFIGKCKDHVV